MTDFTPPPIPPDDDAAAHTQTFAQQAQEAIHADVRMFSGCKDTQTSADVHNVATFQIPADAGPGGKLVAIIQPSFQSVSLFAGNRGWRSLHELDYQNVDFCGADYLGGASAEHADDPGDEGFQADPTAELEPEDGREQLVFLHECR